MCCGGGDGPRGHLEKKIDDFGFVYLFGSKSAFRCRYTMWGSIHIEHFEEELCNNVDVCEMTKRRREREGEDGGIKCLLLIRT